MTGSDVVGCEDTVLYSSRTIVVAIADETTIAGAFGTLETSVELAVAYQGIGIVAQTADEAAVEAFGAIDGHRRAAVVNSDLAAIEHMSHQTACILRRGADGSGCVQVAEGRAAHIAERCLVLAVMFDVDGQRMAITVEDTAIRAVGISYAVATADVGVEAGVDRLSLGSRHILTEGVPVLCVADGEEVFLSVVEKRQGRRAALYIHLYIIIHARARDAHRRVALLALGVVEGDDGAVHLLAVAVAREQQQFHLCPFVPHGAAVGGIVPRHADGAGTLVFPARRVVGNAQQVHLVERARGRGSTVVVPAPFLGDAATHAVGHVVQRAAVLQHAFGYRLHQRAVGVGIDGALVALCIVLFEDGGEVFLLARQRALNLEEVGGCQVLVVLIWYAPLQFHLGVVAIGGGERQTRGGVNHLNILHIRLLVLDEVGSLFAFLVVADYQAEVAVRLVGIEHDGAALHVLDFHAVVLAIAVVVLVRCLDEVVSGNVPGHFQLARVVVVQHGGRDEGRHLGIGLRHSDGHRLQSGHRHERIAVTVALDVPGELQLLAQQVVGHHPLSAEAVSAAVAVALQGAVARVFLGQARGAARVAQRDVEKALGVGLEVGGTRRGAVGESALWRFPLEDGVFRTAVHRHFEVTLVNPHVEAALVIGRCLEIHDVRATKRHRIVAWVIHKIGRRRHLL